MARSFCVRACWSTNIPAGGTGVPLLWEPLPKWILLPLGPGEPPFVPLAPKMKGPDGTGVLVPSGAGDAAADVTREFPLASLSMRERKFRGLGFSFDGVATS